MKDNQYEFVKGVAVSFVILLHTINNDVLNEIGHIFHIGQAVPLFIIVTFILSYMTLSKRKGREISYWFSRKRWSRLMKIIFFPFLCVQIAIWAFLYLSNSESANSFSLVGRGPGSYYPWIYLQFWLIMPFLFLLCSRLPILFAGGLFFIVNEFLQIVCVSCNISESLYRVLCFRYFFLGYLGFFFFKVKIKTITLVFFLLIGSVYYISIDYINFEPFLYNSWLSQQLPAFFYTVVFLKFLLYLYNKLQDIKISKFLVLIGGYSWYIFLLQMIVVVIAEESFNQGIEANWLHSFYYIVVVYVICITPIILYYNLKAKEQ